MQNRQLLLAARMKSRRISKEHRLVYKIEKEIITVISCRYRYE